MLAFQNEIQSQIENSYFEVELLSDPNINYEKLEKIITDANIKCFPTNEVKFNKYKHKISPWMTSGILNSIKFRDKLYCKWKKN